MATRQTQIVKSTMGSRTAIAPENVGRYQILEVLDAHEVADIYRAYDPNFGRGVIVKVLPRKLWANLEFRDLFQR